MFIICWLFFFFSSRRRHTRSLRDWSSDVCSSDLAAVVVVGGAIVLLGVAIPPKVALALELGVAVMLVVLGVRSEEHTSELQSRRDLVCRLLLEKKKKK